MIFILYLFHYKKEIFQSKDKKKISFITKKLCVVLQCRQATHETYVDRLFL